MKLIIHRGTQEIGGTCIEIATDQARILLDAGSPLPPLDGAESGSPALPISLDVTGGEHGRRLDAVFLSHAHGDHSGLVREIPSDIPVCLSRISSKLLLAGACYARGNGLETGRELILEAWRPVRYGDIRVTPVPVDHSAPGAFAFLVESPVQRILYSGDLRWHGGRGNLLDEMVRRLRNRPIDALLMEGTLLGAERRDSRAEEDLVESIANRLRSSEGLACAMYSPQNVDRLLTMIRASTLTNRQLVLDPYALFVLHLMKSETGMPDPFGEGIPIRVWFPNGREAPGTGPLKRVAHEIDRLEITKEEFLDAPGRFLLTFRPWMASEHPEILDRTDVAIWSYWPGYERGSRVAALRERLTSSGIDWFRAHVTGHILPDDLKRLVEELNPKTLIPIHTEHAERFPEYFPERSVLRLRDGEPFTLL